MWIKTLNQFKKDSNKTTKEISALSGVPIGTLNKLFAGQTSDPNFSTIYAVCHSLGHRVDDLLEDGAIVSEKESAPSTKDETLLDSFHQLNDEGQDRLLETADDMVLSGKYIKTEHEKTG